MRRTSRGACRRAGMAAAWLAFALSGLTGPARAQSWLFSPEPISPTALRVEPRSPGAIVVQQPLSVAPAAQPAAVQPAQVPTPEAPATPWQAAGAPPVTLVDVPEPPRRPAGLEAPPAPVQLAAADGSAAAPLPIAPAQAQPPRTVVAAINRAEPLSERAAVDRLNAYLNSFQTLTGDFVQRAGGRQTTGQLYLHRPGRLRFDYDRPSNLEIVADGTSVAIRDRRLNTQDLYLISQTPLKFLTAGRIELGRDLKVVDVSSTADAVRVTVEDRSTLGGTSRVLLVYDPQQNVLKQWTVTDASGAETTVVLSNLQTGKTPDPDLFRINLERILR